MNFLQLCVDNNLKDTHSLKPWGAALILRHPILVVETIRIRLSHNMHSNATKNRFFLINGAETVKKCKKLLSLLDHTPVGQPHHPERQARRRGDACYDKRPTVGYGIFYVKCRTNADAKRGVKRKRQSRFQTV